MTIRVRISLYLGVVFTLLFGLSCLIIFSLFSHFREEEFEDRLKEKALSTIRLLVDVQEVDNAMLKIIDKNTINQLYDEKTLVFDARYNLIYSSLDDTRIEWTREDLDYLRQHKSFFKMEGENEIFGFFYDSNNQDYYALVSAHDFYGKRKLEYLAVLLLLSWAVFVAGTWILSFYIVKRQLKPLDNFQKQLQKINSDNLETKIEVTGTGKNEIDLLGSEFNYMMDRITRAYRSQKEFTSHASHELRTPLARLSLQLENQMLVAPEAQRVFLRNIFHDVNRLNQLITSLLILSRAESDEKASEAPVRVDEVLYNCIGKVVEEFPAFRVDLKIDPSVGREENLEVMANPALLEVAFHNLLRNACMYSRSKSVAIHIGKEIPGLRVTITNDGDVLSDEEKMKLFQPFMRGVNSGQNPGLGLGLRIVQRILSASGHTIQYDALDGLNHFILDFRPAAR